MRTTASYDLFPDARSERALARARWLAREGRTRDAESAYDELLAAKPELKACWAEYFELLRAGGRGEEALQLADRARAVFGETGFSYTLRGAALTELGRYPEALAELERAVEVDPDLALVWHELGYAAWKLGDRNRALLALDRAFALEPHTDTLKLRGQVLREAGRYQAAEVAFEGAAQAAEHAEQRVDAEQEIATTRRYEFYAPRRPDDLTAAERWFADTGSIVLASTPGPVAPSDETIVATFAEVAANCDWHRLPSGSAARDACRAGPRRLSPDRRPAAAAGRSHLERDRRKSDEPADRSRIRSRASGRGSRSRHYRRDRRVDGRGGGHAPGARAESRPGIDRSAKPRCPPGGPPPPSHVISYRLSHPKGVLEPVKSQRQ